jgi:hypothetical protein
MVWFRLVFGLLLAASIGCFAAYLIGRREVWLRRGIVIVKWTLLAAFGFFGVLIAQRLLEL